MKQSGKCLLFLLILGVILSVSETVAQDTPKALIVNGKTVDAAVVQVGGRSYVDIQGLAQAISGSVTFEPTQITLTIPIPTPAAASAAIAEAAPQAGENMSKQFQQIAVFTLAEMREWRGAIGTVVTSGIPVVGTWSQDYHDQIETDLMQATLAASRDSDRQALQPLQNEYAQLTAWADNVLGERKSLDASRNIDPNALQSDQSLAKITKCSQFLSSMIVSGTFSDDSSCQ
jgi:hypothetical protein